ncbi:MAG: J domain-containing protein [Dehalococcoidales bacterium]|nr:J domain-containing protein [Dehalococcoidales bacterium]
MSIFQTRRSYTQPEDAHAELLPVARGLALVSSYHPQLVAELKLKVPPEGRKWDPDSKRWLIDPQYGQTVAKIVEKHLGLTITVPNGSAVATTETRALKLEYLGQCRVRDNGEASSFGWVDGGWNVIVPEQALQSYFEATPTRPDEKPTLYATLAVKQSAGDDEIRSAYRRLARQWHPDVCHEDGATEVFKTIQAAYEVLRDTIRRKKYDMGLLLEASLKKNRGVQVYQAIGTYRPPFRCGWVLAEGTETLARFVVSKILGWEDITNDQGQVMVSSWPKGKEHFEVVWR